MSISTNQFRNGNHIDVDGTVFKILEFQHVKPGKGGAFVRTRLRRASDGAVIDRTFRAGEKFRSVRTEVRRMQFLYRDGTELQVSETEPGLRGDTASGGGNKPAVLETGARIQVPLFIEVGDTVRVDTRSGEYVSRA
jgi:elongation factor P